MLRVALNAFSGIGMGLLIGAIVGGTIGYSYLWVNYEPPNGNPTEVEFFHFMQSGLSVVLVVVGAVFGGGVGAAIGAVTGALCTSKSKTLSKSNFSEHAPANTESIDEQRSG